MNDRPEDAILARYDRALAEHGDSPQGALWPNAEDLRRRYDVMLDLFAERAPEPLVLCDLGCGTGGLLARIRERGLDHVRYIGVDRSRQALELARANHPGVEFLELDITAPGADLSAMACDYLVANGLFTFRHTVSHEDMRAFLEASLTAVWPHVRKGLAFNVMSKQVDWERDDLFHASMDDMAALLHRLAGRRVRMRADYGLYEFTCYAYRMDVATPGPAVARTPDEGGTVPVMRPRLPRAHRLLPYLERIDATRTYTNFGPLAMELEARLARRFGTGANSVVSASTGTSGLVGAILASAGPARAERPLALIPAYTFVATAVAAESCGYTPYLVDVAEDGSLDPGQLVGHPALERAGLVLPVAPYGRPLDQSPWQAFGERTGLPVVIDAAAAFEAASADPRRMLGPIPVVLSLHATKSLASGEGGCVIASNPALIARVREALNFGFHYSRDSRGPSTNGKLSEYHAAVGLAELDDWEQKAQRFAEVLEAYRRHAAAAGFADRLQAAPDIASCYVLLRCRDADEAAAVQQSLHRHGIEFRFWYGLGLHRQTHFLSAPRDPLPATEALAPCLIGLPMAVDLAETAVARVARAVASGLEARS